mgnify:CR=1 FL=1
MSDRSRRRRARATTRRPPSAQAGLIHPAQADHACSTPAILRQPLRPAWPPAQQIDLDVGGDRRSSVRRHRRGLEGHRHRQHGQRVLDRLPDGHAAATDRQQPERHRNRRRRSPTRCSPGSPAGSITVFSQTGGAPRRRHRRLVHRPQCGAERRRAVRARRPVASARQPQPPLGAMPGHNRTAQVPVAGRFGLPASGISASSSTPPSPTTTAPGFFSLWPARNVPADAPPASTQLRAARRSPTT